MLTTAWTSRPTYRSSAQLRPSQICLFPLPGILQNDAAAIIVDNPPLLDLLDRSKAAEAGKIIV
jgi:hypothetical protein